MGAEHKPILRLQGVSANSQGVALIRNISLDIAAGEILAVIGPNGAGKSSLLRAAVGDIEYQAGEVYFADRLRVAYKPRELARQLAYLPQSSELNFPFESRDVVLMGRIPHSSGALKDIQIADEALALVDMSHLANRLYTSLSGGERQRVQLARVLAQIWRADDGSPRVLILDEPCASLDVAHTQALMKGLRCLASEGLAVVMVLHDFTLAARYATTVAALNQGEIAALGTPQEVITRDTIKTLFNVDASFVAHPDTGKKVVVIDD